jgi:putative heme-binding domain-containing protein
VKEVLRVYPALADVAARRDAIQALASRPAWAAALLGELEAGRIPRADLTAYTVRQVASLGDRGLAARINRFWGEARQTPKERQRRIDALVLDLSDELDRADLGNGRALFQTACATCHKLFGEGGRFGPDLTGAQRSSLEYLIQHIVDPDASVARDYQMQIVELADGRVLTGMVTAETETTLTLRTLTEDMSATKGQIRKQRTASVSVMPEGLLDALTKPQIRDLMGYLQSPAQVPLPAAPPPAQ